MVMSEEFGCDLEVYKKKDNVAKSGMRRLFVGDVTIEMLPSGRDISARHCLDFRHSLHLWLLLLSENRSVAHLVCSAAHPRLCHIIPFFVQLKAYHISRVVIFVHPLGET